MRLADEVTLVTLFPGGAIGVGHAGRARHTAIVVRLAERHAVLGLALQTSLARKVGVARGARAAVIAAMRLAVGNAVFHLTFEAGLAVGVAGAVGAR